jgi:hypothetical protein
MYAKLIALTVIETIGIAAVSSYFSSPSGT